MALRTLRLISSQLIAIVFCFLLLSSLGLAQERYVVSSTLGNLNVYSLSDNSLVESFGAGANPMQTVISPNQRIGYFVNNDNPYVSVVDFTIQREIRRIYGVQPSNNATAALTPDGTLLLVPTYQGKLNIYRTSTFQLVKSVDLTHIVGAASLMILSSVVVVNNKAYVNTSYNVSSKNAVAVVDLSTFVASAIPVPPEGGYNNTLFAGDTAATPDGKYVLMLQSSNVLLISTATNTVQQNIVLSGFPYLIAITPTASPNGVFGYLVADDGFGDLQAEMMDLRPTSPNFGQLIPGAVANLPGFFAPASIAINADGTRLVVLAFRTTAPQPDTFVLDTQALLNDPQNAIISELRLGDTIGPYLHNVAISQVQTIPPQTAPVVTSVTGTPINNQSTPIQINGSNFASGAFVRVGSMAPIAATLINSTKLKVTIPRNAPAGDALDVIVTNRNVNAPVQQQQQSGLLAGQLKISPNPSFQPKNQALTSDMSENTVSLLLPDNTMHEYPVGIAPGSFAMAPDGVHAYVVLLTSPISIACFNLQSNTVQAVISLPQGSFLYNGGIVAANSPTTGTPVIYAGTYRFQGGEKEDLLQIDANPSSPNFNHIINTWEAALNSNFIYGGSTGVSPDGRFAFVSEGGNSTITAFDTLLGTNTTLSTSSLGVNFYQQQVTVTPDGKTLLLNTPKGAIAVFDISANPFSPVRIATIAPVLPKGIGSLFLSTYQVVGTQLFAFDPTHNTVEMFNFDRTSQNYSFLGLNVVSGRSAYSAYLAVSPDGKLVYVPQNGEDSLVVLDASLLAINQPALITKIATGRVPSAVAVNPVPR